MTGVMGGLALLAILACLATKWIYTVRCARMRRTLDALRKDLREVRKVYTAKVQERRRLEVEGSRASQKIKKIEKATAVNTSKLEELQAMEEKELETLRSQKELLDAQR